MKNNYCKIIGYGSYTDKETGELKLRINISVDSIYENYYGQLLTTVFLPQNDELESDLRYAIDNKLNIEYITKINVITKKVEIIGFKFNEWNF